jgi:hypothetical protein
MVAKKNSGATRLVTVGGTALNAEYAELPLEKVQLSPKNPRLYQLLRRNPSATPEDIQKFLLEQDGVPELQRQIRENKGLVDPIIVDSNYNVIEGNCRTAIYLKLREGRVSEPQWRTIPAYVLTEATKRQTMILQAIYHVHTNKIRWGAYEQQNHLHAMRTKLKMEPPEIARVLGLSEGEVQNLLDAYAAMTKHYLAKAKPGEERKVWSHFLEFQKSPKLASFRSKEENVALFARLVKDKRIQKGADVRKLHKIVSNPKALQTLAKDGLEAAVREVGKADPSKIFPLFRQVRRTAKLLKGLTSTDLDEIRKNAAKQKEIRALYDAVLGVAKATSIQLK